MGLTAHCAAQQVNAHARAIDALDKFGVAMPKVTERQCGTRHKHQELEGWQCPKTL
jgi:hypothetical protein